MRLFLLFFLSFIYFSFANGADSNQGSIPKHKWSFNGLTGTFDKASIQRGYKVYREVCSGCHSMDLLYYRDLLDIGFSEDEV